MNGEVKYDALVIGGGAAGLVAATYLARAHARVLVLQAPEEDVLPHTLAALDPQVVKDLRLVRHGLQFALRDMPLTSLRADGKHLVLTRNEHASARAIAAQAASDGEAFVRQRREFFALARRMRQWWWEDAAAAEAAHLLHRENEKRALRHLTVESAEAYLGERFESDALKAVLAFDATAGGLSADEPGGALALLWHAAQEMCGLQGAFALPRGGTQSLLTALRGAAKAAATEIRPDASVARLILHDGVVAGVELVSGEHIFATAVLSTLSRRRTLLVLAPAMGVGLGEARLLGRAEPGAGEANMIFTLNAAPAFSGTAVPAAGRFIVADRLGTYAAAHGSARAGRLPDDLVLEIVVPSAAEASLVPAGQVQLSVLARPLPLAPPEGWDTVIPMLLRKVVATLERYAPGITGQIVTQTIRPPSGTDDPVTAARLLAPYRARLATGIEGLWLCGAPAEPVGAISGRAARHAAAHTLAYLARKAAP